MFPERSPFCSLALNLSEKDLKKDLKKDEFCAVYLHNVELDFNVVLVFMDI